MQLRYAQIREHCPNINTGTLLKVFFYSTVYLYKDDTKTKEERDTDFYVKYINYNCVKIEKVVYAFSAFKIT